MPGRLLRHEHFASDWVTPRPVEVWTPPGYDEAEALRYPVLYMHDGQNLFDAGLSFSGVPWGVDKAAAKLDAEGQIHQAPLIVGIWNTKRRAQEYMPQKPFETAPALFADHFVERFGSAPLSDAYLRFIVEELKPFIDTTYRTLPAQAHTSMMGSSMGGLISLYALCQYPDVFGGVACLSPSWTVAGRILMPYLERCIPPPEAHKVYFDYGSEARLATYEAYQKQTDRLFVAAGYQRDLTWTTRRFPGADHSEQAWQDRIDEPLLFLLKRRKP